MNNEFPGRAAETPAPKRHGVRETVIRALTRGPGDEMLKRRAEWMIEELKIGRYLAPKIKYKEPGVLKPNNVERGVTVVSIGSGKGHELDEMDMILPGSRIIGMDPDDYMTKPVAERLEKLAHDPSYLGTHNRAEDMKDIPDGSADGVTLNFVLHHIHEPMHDRIFEEVKRVLKKDGFLFMAEDLVDSEAERKVVEREDRKINMEITADAPHHYRSAKEWNEYFKQHGFEVVDQHEVKPGKVRHGFFVLQQISEKK
jgi:ubiquinone/menaquinone biosynthesis C-methylase UbiE